MHLKRKLRRSIQRIREHSPTLVSYCKGLKRLWTNEVKRNVSGFGNHISTSDAWLVSVEFDIQGSNNSIVFEPDCFLRNVRFFIRGDGHKVVLSRGCRFNNGGRIRLEDYGCSLVVGEGTSFEDVHLALTEPHSSIEIGKDCMFAYDIDVRTGDSHSILCQTTRRRLNHAKNVRVGDHVWIGPHSMLLKGVSLASDSIVAAGAVVTKQFQTPGIIIGGNPARQLKDNVTWCRERIYDV